MSVLQESSELELLGLRVFIPIELLLSFLLLVEEHLSQLKFFEFALDLELMGAKI